MKTIMFSIIAKTIMFSIIAAAITTGTAATMDLVFNVKAPQAFVCVGFVFGMVSGIIVGAMQD